MTAKIIPFPCVPGSPTNVCWICRRALLETDGGVVEPAHVWICNECLKNRVIP